MYISYDYYRAFYYAARYKSVSKAAALLQTSQPNVTIAVKKLEQALNCRLFERSNHGVRMTPEGKRLYKHVAIACEQLQAGEDELSDYSGSKGGIVVISVSEIALHTVLLHTLKTFHPNNPGIRLRIFNHSAPKAIASLAGGASDLALVASPFQVAAPLKETQLLPFQEIAIGGPAFKTFAEEKRSLAELAAQPMIGLASDSATYHFYQQLFLSCGLPYNPETEADTADQILPMAANDLGIGFVPVSFAATALNRRQIVQIPLTDEIPERYICLITDTSRPLSSAAKKLTMALRAYGRLSTGQDEPQDGAQYEE